MNTQHLENIRLEEFQEVLAELRERNICSGALLEIGAGAGWQAREFARHGYSVSAVDVDTSNYREQRVWEVATYDGLSLPFSDNSFDVVFSSNVLEHIDQVECFQIEILRVMKQTGLVVHIVPSATWRFWTNVAHVFFLGKLAIRTIRSVKSEVSPKVAFQPPVGDGARTCSLGKRIWRTLIIQRHGEVGSNLGEHYYFSRFRWNALFRHTGWKIEKHRMNRLFYSGYNICGPLLSTRMRNLLSRFLGSACHIYFLRK